MSGNLVRFPSPKPHFVLDTWPVMEWLKNRQPQAEKLRLLIERANNGEIELSMSMINVGEVFYNSAWEWGAPRAEQIPADLRAMPIRLVSASDREVMAAARFKVKRGLSYADAFARVSRHPLAVSARHRRRRLSSLRGRGQLRLVWLGV